jgi:small redox-active disulfide protein 2
MVIKILGTGCKKCNLLQENAQKAIADAGLDIPIEKVTDLGEISGYGVMSTPALVIDERVISQGKVLKPQEIQAFIQKLQ